MALADTPNSQLIKDIWAAVFPLPLTPIEAYMLADGRREYPMLCDLELHFQGRIDREAFDAALEFALDRNPLFRALVVPHQPGGWAWVLSDQSPQVDWQESSAPLSTGYNAFIDLTREIGLRIWVRVSDQRSDVLLHFHHATSDGIGGYRFIEDLLAGYTQFAKTGTPVDPRPLEPQRLLKRGQAGLVKRTPLQQVFDLWVGLREGLRFFWQAPRPMPVFSGRETAEGQPISLSAMCPAETTTKLRGAASRSKATVNDLLMRDLFFDLAPLVNSGGKEAASQDPPADASKSS